MYIPLLIVACALASVGYSAPLSNADNPSWSSYVKGMAKAPTSAKEQAPKWFCMEYNDPLDLSNRREWPCKAMTKPNATDASRLTRRQQNGNNQFRIRFQCRGVQKQICDKAQNEFELAGQILSASLQLSQPLTVDAQFFSFCRELGGNCQNGRDNRLGFASPARMLPMQDDDGVVRMFPQALVKQLGVQGAQMASNDIIARFNTDFPYRFVEDNQQNSGRQQIDFLEVVMHELTHGLGFLSLWSDSVARGANLLTPQVNVRQSSNGVPVIQGFVESAFDRFMVTVPERQPMTKLTQQLSQVNGGRPIAARSLQEFASILANSPQGNIAAQLGQKGVGGARGQGLAFQASREAGGKLVLLETSLNPFVAGSSVSHVDRRSHLRSKDRLMMFSVDPSIAFENSLRQFGNPVGPELTAVLSSIGYKVQPANAQTVIDLVNKAKRNVPGANRVVSKNNNVGNMLNSNSIENSANKTQVNKTQQNNKDGKTQSSGGLKRGNRRC
ncbi:uncharacterized protein VTP21DRAFT_10767 [Calcarisporiella thermophila]|uniref:uncharacterized protein n=1 Tax=Calcarisporiella thermophila TaxID=911321 RepID=UPI0037444B06